MASDAFGNSSEFETAFLWGPTGSLFNLDSSRTVDSANIDFYFSPSADLSGVAFDSAAVFLNRLDKWGRTPDVKAKLLTDGSLRVHALALSTSTAALRLDLYPTGGYSIEDNIFNGIQPSGTSKVRLKYDVIDDGLLITLYGDIRFASTSRVELFADGKRFETVYPRFFTMQHHVAFLKPTHSRRKIDRIDYVLSRVPNHVCFIDDSVRLHVAGLEENEIISVGEKMEIHTGRKDFFSPAFIETHERSVASSSRQINSDKFVISPESILSRSELKLLLKLNPANTTNRVAGLCRFDDKKNIWRWIETGRGGDSVTGSTAIGGTFATIIDVDPPTISRLNVKHLGVVYQKRPRITMSVTDNLAGLADDQNFLIKIDGEWVIPDYDPETTMLTVLPRTDLKDGEHHLSIEITDRLGHKAEKYVRFNVNTQLKAGKRR